MSEQQPIDWEATAASVLNSAMMSAIGLLVVIFDFWMLAKKIGNLNGLLKFDWAANSGLILGAVGACVLGGRFAWFALKDLRQLPVRVRPPSIDEGALSRRDLIRQAPWVDVLPKLIRVRSVIDGVIGVAILAGLWGLVWWLPEPLGSQLLLIVVGVMAVVRLVEWAWKHYRRA